MDITVRIIIGVFSAGITVLCGFIVKMLVRARNEKKKLKGLKDNGNVVKRAYERDVERNASANIPEDRKEYRKTEHLGMRAFKNGNRDSAQAGGQFAVEEIPVLSLENKTEIQRRIDSHNRTEYLGNSDQERKPGAGNTEMFGEKYSENPRALLKYLENNKPMEYEMCTEFIYIGRDPNLCDVVINEDNYLSKQHAIILYRKNRFHLVDVNSKNGTFLGNNRIVGSTEVSGNCKFKLAKTEIEFIILER
jgi:hypothetical protein